MKNLITRCERKEARNERIKLEERDRIKTCTTITNKNQSTTERTLEKIAIIITMSKKKRLGTR